MHSLLIPCLDPSRSLPRRPAPGLRTNAPKPASRCRTHMFRGAYEPPKNPQHQEFYEFLKNSQVLEKFSVRSAPSGCPGRS